jgi:uncharacterized protein Yka (UPF0111/DUF47 family)
LSETISLIGSIQDLASNVVQTSKVLLSICKSLEDPDSKIETLINDLTKSEEKTDSLFEDVAERIMSVEFLNINPDYLLDIAKHVDEISDLLERAGLLFQYLGKFSDQDIFVLLNDAATQVQKIATDVVECLGRLATGSGNIKDIADVLSDREKAVDALREEFNSQIVSNKSATIDQKIWLKEIFGNLDQIADIGRDLGILFRVVGVKLDKQRTLTLKHIPQ